MTIEVKYSAISADPITFCLPGCYSDGVEFLVKMAFKREFMKALGLSKLEELENENK